jgi:hypothetical protein
MHFKHLTAHSPILCALSRTCARFLYGMRLQTGRTVLSVSLLARPTAGFGTQERRVPYDGCTRSVRKAH